MLVRQAQVREQRVTVALVEVRVAAMSRSPEAAGGRARDRYRRRCALLACQRSIRCSSTSSAALATAAAQKPRRAPISMARRGQGGRPGGVGDRDRVDRLIGQPGGQALLVLLQPRAIDRVVIEALKRCDQPPARFRLPSVGNDIRWQDLFRGGSGRDLCEIPRVIVAF
jgi:hypothetical protein